MGTLAYKSVVFTVVLQSFDNIRRVKTRLAEKIGAPKSRVLNQWIVSIQGKIKLNVSIAALHHAKVMRFAYFVAVLFMGRVRSHGS